LGIAKSPKEKTRLCTKEVENTKEPARTKKNIGRAPKYWGTTHTRLATETGQRKKKKNGKAGEEEDVRNPRS